MIDIWNESDRKKVDGMTCYFKDLNPGYYGVFYVGNKAVGDYTAENSQEVENIANAFCVTFEWGI